MTRFYARVHTDKEGRRRIRLGGPDWRGVLQPVLLVDPIPRQTPAPIKLDITSGWGRGYALQQRAGSARDRRVYGRDGSFLLRDVRAERGHHSRCLGCRYLFRNFWFHYLPARDAAA